MLNLFFFFSFSVTLFVIASNGGKVLQEELVADKPIDFPHLPWTIYAYGPNGFARERAVPNNPNVIGYPFPLNTWAMNPSFLLFFFLLAISLFWVTNPFFFKLQPTIQEHEELVWLVES